MDTIENKTEVEKLRDARRQAAEAHAAMVDRKLTDADNALEAAILALGHTVTRHQQKHYDYETKVETLQIGSIEYVDDVYFGADWGFYEQGSNESTFNRKNGNGKLAFRYHEPVTYEKRIIRERKEFAGGFDFPALATVLIALAIAARPAAIEKSMEWAQREMEEDFANRRRKAVEAYSKEVKASITDERIKQFSASTESWGRSERIEISFMVDDLETAKAVIRDYFSKQ